MKNTLLLTLLMGALPLVAQATDWRDLQNGSQIPDESYTDQPYFVVLEDGKWLLTLTTGPGGESNNGQHVVSTTSADNGQTWTPLVDIEVTGPNQPAPDTNILSSWVSPFRSGYRAPGAAYNRVYAIYTWSDPYITSPVFTLKSLHGPYAFRYTDDGGTTWSSRHIIPYTNTEVDDNNIFSGAYPAGWNVDKPLRLNGKMFLCFTKLNAVLGGPSSTLGEGYIYRCDNIDTEGDPTALDWKMLPGTVNPDGSVDTAARGIKRAEWSNSLQVEFDLQSLTSGALMVIYRTAQGVIGEALSTDEGETWTEPAPLRYHLDGRFLRHNRANTKIWKLNSGKYLLWHNNNGFTSYANRNPVWVSIGTQAGNGISWGEPEIFLYDRDKGLGISYPDMMEVGGTMYVTETEKHIARVHEIDPGFLAMIDTQPSRSTKTTADLQFEETGTVSGSYAMPTLPTLSGYEPKGFTIETRFQTSNFNAGQTIFDTFSGGSGVRMTVNTLGAVDFLMSDGTNSITWRSDTGTVVAGQPTHIAVHVDAAAKVLTMVANGKVCDGTDHNTGIGDPNRIFGWTHFDSAFGDVNGGDIAVGSGLNGSVSLLRVYDRALMHTEAIGNYRNASGISGPAVSAGIVPAKASGEPGQSVTFDASHSYASELTSPVYTWDFGDGSPTVQGASVNHAFSTTGSYTVTMTISEAGTPTLQGHPAAVLAFDVQEVSVQAAISALRPAGSKTVTFSAEASTLTNLPDPVYTWNFGDGNSATGLSLQHTYASAGDYTVTLTISRSGGGSVAGTPVAAKVVNAGGSSPVGDILTLSHDGTSGDEADPFDTVILQQSSDWTYTTDDGRSIMTASDITSGDNPNRLILVQKDGVSEFSDTGTAADKGWVFEIEFEILAGAGSGAWAPFALFGVRSENEAGKSAWVGMSDIGGTDGKGRIGFIDDTGTSSDRFLAGATADLDVDSLIGDGQYHNFKVHKYDDGGTTKIDVFMDGALVLSSAYSALLDDQANKIDIQGFASADPATSEVNIDFIDFTLYDNLIESSPADDTAPVLESTTPTDGAFNVLPNANLVAHFNEAIRLKSGGTITITDLDDGSGTLVINLLDAARASVSGTVLMINPVSDLDLNTNYEITIDANAIEDRAAIPNAYSGTSSGEWTFGTVVENLPPAVLVDLNADGTARNASAGEFEDAIGLAAATFSGSSVTHINFNDPTNTTSSPIRSGTADSITFTASSTNFSLGGDADGWFGDDTSPNKLLEDGVFMRNDSGDPSGTLTFSGSGLGLSANRNYELYLFAGRSQGHETTFTFADTAIHTNPPVVGGDETQGTAMFTFETGASPPASLAIQWDGLQNASGNQDAVVSGFALRDIGPVNNFANWIGRFSLTDTSFDGDDDGDGLGNGAEAFFGTHPGVSNPGLTEVSMSANTVTFRHPNPDTPLNDVSGSYRWSLDLVTWYAADNTEGDGNTTVNAVATPDSPAANVTTVEATIGGTVPSRIFLRAVATTL